VKLGENQREREKKCTQKERDKDVARTSRRGVQDTRQHHRYAPVSCCLGIDNG